VKEKTVYPFLALPHRARRQPLRDIVTDISGLQDRKKQQE